MRCRSCLQLRSNSAALTRVCAIQQCVCVCASVSIRVCVCVCVCVFVCVPACGPSDILPNLIPYTTCPLEGAGSIGSGKSHEARSAWRHIVQVKRSKMFLVFHILD